MIGAKVTVAWTKEGIMPLCDSCRHRHCSVCEECSV